VLPLLRVDEPLYPPLRELLPLEGTRDAVEVDEEVRCGCRIVVLVERVAPVERVVLLLVERVVLPVERVLVELVERVEAVLCDDASARLVVRAVAVERVVSVPDVERVALCVRADAVLALPNVRSAVAAWRCSTALVCMSRPDAVRACTPVVLRISRALVIPLFRCEKARSG
jgi:hypothetical protein